MAEELVEVGDELEGLLDLPQRSGLPEAQLRLGLADVEFLVVLEEACAGQGHELEAVAVGALLDVDACARAWSLGAPRKCRPSWVCRILERYRSGFRPPSHSVQTSS